MFCFKMHNREVNCIFGNKSKRPLVLRKIGYFNELNNSIFLVSISLQPDGVRWNFEGLQTTNTKI